VSENGDGLLGQARRKLIEAKRAWAREGRLLTGRSGDPGHERLPPGQHQVKNWPVLDLGVQPDVPLDKWRLAIDGLVESPMRWTWEEFSRQPVTRLTSDIHCVTAWSRFDNRWEGVAARQVISAVRPKPEAKFVILHSFDTYTTNVPLSAFDDDALLAHEWQGAPIPREHGGPVRIVIPKLYFWKSAKWVKRIEFAATDRAGFWEARGYHNTGDPWREERYG
jgi:DMSO/TMAO reductase YedYZ molybdopterin-dependent catalytic subunit